MDVTLLEEEEEEEAAFVELGLLRKICHAADHESCPTAPAPATPFRHGTRSHI